MSLEPYWSDGDLSLHLGDCLDLLSAMEPGSVDAVVTDPPYGLEFMGSDWDKFAPADSPMTATQRADHMNRSESYGPWGRGDRPIAPNDYGHRNERCQRCGKWRISSNRCQCDEPLFEYRIRDSAPPSMLAYQEWCTRWARECRRVLKPGGWLLAFGGTRTWHRLTCAIEDAGFEIRDSVADLTGQDAPGLMWVYASGFPKSLDVSKAIDKAAGAEREVVGPDRGRLIGAQGGVSTNHGRGGVRYGLDTPTAPATDEATVWDGWGTALKPAWEPIVVGRKPLAGTVAQNVLAHGTGALNIDACRVAYEAGGSLASNPSLRTHISGGNGGEVIAHESERRTIIPNDAGRWPSNVLLTHSALCEPAGLVEVRSDGHHPASRGAGGVSTSGHAGQQGLTERKGGTETVQAWDCAPGCPVAELDRQSGVLTSGANPTRRSGDKFRDAYGEFAGQRECEPARGADSGGASRFFPVFKYEPKAPASERPRLPDGTAHMTVKPVDLMCWLVRLVSRRGALILDPFAGSGTTGEACAIEGRGCVLIERDERFAELIKVRLRKPIQPGMFDLEAS